MPQVFPDNSKISTVLDDVGNIQYHLITYEDSNGIKKTIKVKVEKITDNFYGKLGGYFLAILLTVFLAFESVSYSNRDKDIPLPIVVYVSLMIGCCIGLPNSDKFLAALTKKILD